MAIQGFENGILSVLSNATIGAVEGAAKGLASLGSGIGKGLSAGSENSLSNSEGVFAGLKEVFGIGSLKDAPANDRAVASATPATEIYTPAPSMKNTAVVMHFDNGALGDFAAPTFKSTALAAAQQLDTGGRTT